MLFTTLEYLFFLPLVVAGYFLLSPKWRWLWLLGASYGFYMSHQPLFGLLLLGSTTLDYWAARKMDGIADKAGRRIYMRLSILGNIGALLLFKYLGFFNELVGDIANLAGAEYTFSTWDIVFPLGISFYTFQSLSYTIDVYRGDRPAEKHFGMLALYVSFFPQLIAGPIERSTRLLPQLKKEHKFSWLNLIIGLRLILWGVFKKVALADRIGHYINVVYDTPEDYHGFTYVVVGGAFVLQVLFDFGAYTDIAVGSAKIFGVDLSINFNKPLHSINIRQFWRRWHLSMSTWFFEYLYKPLGRKLRLGWQLNIMIFMLVVGFWHGPRWGFLIFGLIHGVYYITSDYLPAFESEKSKSLNIILKGLAMFGIFWMVAFSAFFFRAETIADAWYALTEASTGLLSFDYSLAELKLKTTDVILISLNLGLFAVVQNFPKHDPKDPLAAVPWRPIRWAIYLYLLFMILSLAHAKMQDFIYFHF